MRRKALLSTCFVLLIGVAVLVASKSGNQLDGRCGTQRWAIDLLVWEYVVQPPFDGYGIRDRWEQAHGKLCSYIWGPGAFAVDDSEYWPPLHLKIAMGVFADGVAGELASRSDTDIRSKDALGRTLMHWAVVHPDAASRETLMDVLLKRGLSLDQKDDDGLSPADWRSRYEQAAR